MASADLSTPVSGRVPASVPQHSATTDTLPNVGADAPAHGLDQASISFRESRIAMAVDVSGSTWGPTLETEKRAINSVCSLIPKSIHSNITILPWNDLPGRPLSVSSLANLESDGGTDPNVILQDPHCRLKLQQAAFWFLMTDGIIDESLVRSFAQSLTGYGMHGKACIISVFGERVLKPSDCNISVGLSVFAVSPHVAFLYTDVEFNKTYVLSTKGCFSALLPPGKRNPKLDYNTKWDDLPQVSYENLTRISVPPPTQGLGKDEIALQDNSRISLAALLSQQTVDEKVMREIMLNEDNMRSVAITAKLRGESDKLGAWLDKVEDKIAKDDQQDQYEQEVLESQLFKDVEARIMMREGNVHAPGFPQRSPTAKPPSSKIQKASRESSHMRQSSTTMRTLSYSDMSMPGDNLSTCPYDDLISPPNSLNLANAGFLRPTQGKEYFSGTCSKCGVGGAVMTLLLTTPIVLPPTDNFPVEGSVSKLIYPLAMGNYPETDIISNTLVCDECSAEMARVGFTPRGEALAGVLPLVSYSKNQDAWLQTVYLATKKRFSRSDIAMVFLAILFTKLERLLSAEGTVNPSLRLALEWECNMIQSQVVLVPGTTPTTDQFGTGTVLEALLRNFRDALNTDKSPLLLRYPLDGFIVANAALSNSRHNGVLSGEKRKTIVLLRFLYHLVENVCAYGKENGEVQLHAAKNLVLLMDDPSGPRSLFRWNSVRQFSIIFKNVEELRKHLRERVAPVAYKLSVTVSDLVDTPLLSAANLADFRRLGVLSNWIESQTGHAVAIFVHHLLRVDFGDCSPEEVFQRLRNDPGVKEALADPAKLSARDVELVIKSLPPLE